jgi:hypothetical protein
MSEDILTSLAWMDQQGQKSNLGPSEHETGV